MRLKQDDLLRAAEVHNSGKKVAVLVGAGALGALSRASLHARHLHEWRGNDAARTGIAKFCETFASSPLTFAALAGI